MGLVVAALVLGACGDDTSDPTTATTAADDPVTPDTSTGAAGEDLGERLAGRSFVGDDVEAGGEPRPLAAGSSLRLAFDDDLALTASAGCNTIGGDASIDGDELVVVEAGITLMACPGNENDQERWWLELLTDRPEVALDGDVLTLDHEDTTVRLTEETAAEPDLAVVGTSWEITSTVQGTDQDGAVSDGPGRIGTLFLDANGTFEIATPCLVRSGTYIERGDDRFVLSITDDQAQPCEEPDAELEAVVDAVLVQGATAQVDGDQMTLWAGDVGLGLQADPQR